MNKFMRIKAFAKQLYVKDKTAQKASEILAGILEAQSPRISDIADKMAGNYEKNYKKIQRFLKNEQTHEMLNYLFNEEAEYVIVDPTEIERPGAKKTEYVGKLMDGETRGFWMLTLATPIRGRAIPFHFTIYSSSTIQNEASSRNLEHQKAIEKIKALIGSQVMIFDREFSYLDFLDQLHRERVAYVIRLNLGSHQPKLYQDKKMRHELKLRIAHDGKPKVYYHMYYKGVVPVNVIGIWQKGFKKPLWIITNLPPELALRIYEKRMKIEVSFRDLKSLLHIHKIMNKSRRYLENMIALVLLAYTIGLLIGEAIRDVLYAGVDPDRIDLLFTPNLPPSSKWFSFSGLFILLKRRRRLSPLILRKITSSALLIFSNLVFGNCVRSFVGT